jgi:hypothetical protein
MFGYDLSKYLQKNKDNHAFIHKHQMDELESMINVDSHSHSHEFSFDEFKIKIDSKWKNNFD